jgi:type I restriction-modification system DNA methylase subunit
LFELIKQDSDLIAAKMFNEHDLLSEKMSDKFVSDYFVVPFEKYFFYTTKVDGLGSAYEVLGQISGRDTKAGQFFTPENIVRFMVMLADLKSDDVVLDFACGTARFLIYAMYDMIAKVLICA